jgi:hypothetical protein
MHAIPEIRVWAEFSDFENAAQHAVAAMTWVTIEDLERHVYDRNNGGVQPRWDLIEAVRARRAQRDQLRDVGIEQPNFVEAVLGGDPAEVDS